MNRSVQWTGLFLVIGTLLMGAGCESSRDVIVPSHDFGDNNPDLILCVGDSITEGYGVLPSQNYPALLRGMLGMTVINAGVGGETSGGGRRRFKELLDKHKPGYVLIKYGTNDIRLQDTTATINNLKSMIRSARQRKSIPIVATVIPAFWGYTYMQPLITVVNAEIRLLARAEDVNLADIEAAFNNDTALMHPDGLHPNAKGMIVIAETFAAQID